MQIAQKRCRESVNARCNDCFLLLENTGNQHVQILTVGSEELAERQKRIDRISCRYLADQRQNNNPSLITIIFVLGFSPVNRIRNIVPAYVIIHPGLIRE